MEIFLPVNNTHAFMSSLQSTLELSIERDRILIDIAHNQRTMQPNAERHANEQIDIAAFVARCFRKSLDEKQTNELREVERTNFARKLMVGKAARVMSSKFANARTGIRLDLFNAMRYVERVGVTKLPAKRT